MMMMMMTTMMMTTMMISNYRNPKQEKIVLDIIDIWCYQH